MITTQHLTYLRQGPVGFGHSRSALAGVFREYTLTFEGATGHWTTDEYGNPIAEIAKRTMTVNFEAYQTPQVQFMEGADANVVRGRGTCIQPASMPAAITPGAELRMTYAGRPGVMRIITIAAAPLAVLDETLGQEFIGEWRAT